MLTKFGHRFLNVIQLVLEILETRLEKIRVEGENFGVSHPIFLDKLKKIKEIIKIN